MLGVSEHSCVVRFSQRCFTHNKLADLNIERSRRRVY